MHRFTNPIKSYRHQSVQGGCKVVGCGLVASTESEACEGDRTTFALV